MLYMEKILKIFNEFEDKKIKKLKEQNNLEFGDYKSTEQPIDEFNMN